MKLGRRGFLGGVLASPAVMGSSAGAPVSEDTPIQMVMGKLDYTRFRLNRRRMMKKYDLTEDTDLGSFFSEVPEHSIYNSFKSVAPWKKQEMYIENFHRVEKAKLESFAMTLEKMLDLPEEILKQFFS